ncbi:MAG: serine/threonine-protein kinase, partial [Acidobacteriia bacterium]|nr:serine/threonine-protein kinase [Terriglobia bacterium]
MPVSSGDRLGPYEIRDRLGAGGMGEVFLAQDTRLGRSVAVKVSAERFNERFEREARLIASLNHPNICTLYDVGPDYLVMELVEGPTLEDRLKEGPIPLDEALVLARQIAEALQAAHEKGIVHRDLKPVNIKLKHDGTVKVLDFGLATAAGTAAASAISQSSPTLAMGTTMAGTILGTAGYMAPEQARGKPVDKRADIWAYGVIVYEMLTGQKLFEGETVSDSLAAVITKEPDLNRVPFQVRRMLRGCLQKDPRHRLHDIGDAMLLLDEAPAPALIAAQRPPRQRWVWLWPAAAVAFAIVFSLLSTLRQQPAATAETLRFQIPAPDKVTLVRNGIFALSPDGRKVVFWAIENGEQKLWIRSMDSLEAHPIAGANSISPAPMFWSPDSRYVAFDADGKLKRVDINGGPPDVICDLAGGGSIGGSWNRNGVILFGAGNGRPIMRVPATGGTATPVTALNTKGTTHVYPVFLEDRKHFLYMVYNGGSDGGIYAGSLDANPAQQSTKLLFRAQGLLTYLPSTSRVLFVRVGALYSQAFNTRNLAAEGEPIVVQQQVAVETNLLFARASVSEKNLVFRSSSGEDLELTWLDRNGKPLDTIGEAGHYTVLSVLALSRDGTRAAVSRPDASGNFDIWLIDLKTGAGTRFTFDPAYDTAPVWSSDGSRVIFLSVGRRGGTGLYEKATNGAGAERVVLQPVSARTITDWSRDGRYLLFNGNDTLWVLPLEGERKPIPFLRSNFEGVGARLSPDGHWIAFRSRESGRDEIYVESFSPVVDGGTAASTSKWMVSKDGGAGMIHWRQDG